MEKKPILTIDWESWANAVIPKEKWNDIDHDVVEPTFYILEKLKERKITAIFYVLGWLRDRHPELYEYIKQYHVIGSHGYWHGRNEMEEGLFRSPYWDCTPMPGLCGGFAFRVLPLWYVRKEVLRTGIFYLHPHDVARSHPRLENPLLNMKRQIGLKNARPKFEKLIDSIKWGKP